MKRSDLRVAVVDDTAVSRHLITEVLDWMEVFNYTAYNNGASALSGLATTPVHLVISDFHMALLQNSDRRGFTSRIHAVRRVA